MRTSRSPTRLRSSQSHDLAEMFVGSALSCWATTSAPFRTNAGGYLLGRGEIEIGDSLVALWRAPDGQPESGRYTVYYTSARPTETAWMRPGSKAGRCPDPDCLKRKPSDFF